MMTKGKSDITKADIDNQLLVQMKLLGVKNGTFQIMCHIFVRIPAKESDSSLDSYIIFYYIIEN